LTGWRLSGVRIPDLDQLTNATNANAAGNQQPANTPTAPSTSTETARPVATPLNDEERNKFLTCGWGFSAASETEIVRQFGKPNHVSHRKIENRHQPGQMDEIVELQYEGLSMTFYRIGSTDQLVQLTIANAKFPIAHDLGVGTESDRIVQLFGRPEGPQKDGEFCFKDNMSGQSSVTFKYANGRIETVTWESDLD
jgi:hypothetical protein